MENTLNRLHTWVLEQLIDAEAQFISADDSSCRFFLRGVKAAFSDTKGKIESLLNQGENVQVSDTTGVQSSNAAG